MKIKVLGPACINCERTALNVHKALEELNIQADVEQVREPKRIFLQGVTNTPAVLIEEILASEGRVPDIEEIERWIEQMKNWREKSAEA